MKKEAIKICLFYESVFTLGGVQRCVTALSNYLVDRHYDVTILCTNTKAQLDRSIYGLDERVKIIFVKTSPINRALHIFTKPIRLINNKFGTFRNSLPILSLAYYRYLKDSEQVLADGNFDIVIGCAAHAAALAIFKKLQNTVRIGWQHSNHQIYFHNKGKLFWHQDAIIKAMADNLDEYVVLTEQDSVDLKEDKQFEAITIHNPIDFKQEKKSNLRNKKILAAGRLGKIKGFDMLLDAFAIFHEKHPEWALDIVGEGLERHNLEEQIQSLGLGDVVRLTGRKNNMPELYTDASIFCMSSRAEGWGLVMAEAMECGLPVISFDIPSAELIIGDAGILVPQWDVKEYAKAMADLANNLNKRQSYAKKSINRAKGFHIERIGKEWEQLFGELIDHKEGNENQKNLKK